MKEKVIGLLSLVSQMFSQSESVTQSTTESEMQRESGQSHILEIIVGILIVVVLGVFLYTTGVPSIEALWNDAMTTIGTIGE